MSSDPGQAAISSPTRFSDHSFTPGAGKLLLIAPASNHTLFWVVFSSKSYLLILPGCAGCRAESGPEHTTTTAAVGKTDSQSQKIQPGETSEVGPYPKSPKGESRSTIKLSSGAWQVLNYRTKTLTILSNLWQLEGHICFPSRRLTGHQNF